MTMPGQSLSLREVGASVCAVVMSVYTLVLRKLFHLMTTKMHKSYRSVRHGLRFCNQTKTTAPIKIATKIPIIAPFMFFSSS